MKRTVFFIFLGLLAAISLQAAPRAKTSFAVVTDEQTLTQCRAQIVSYMQTLEKEGLKCYLLSSDWTSPEPIRAWLKQKAADKKAPLEGAVFVGDVPVVMLRGAQHLTTAFKMDQDKYPIEESSVPSDRFYDDFGLEFDFFKKKDSLYYYTLSDRGDQFVRPDIYSARIRVPESMQGDKYDIIRKYLDKAVAAHKERNMLDCMVFYAGNGYNSDCLTLWRQKPLAFRETMPLCFAKAPGNKFMNFRQDTVMKYSLFSQLRRPELDYIHFSEHGAPETQYTGGFKSENSLDDCIDGLQNTLLYYYRHYKGKKNEEEFLHETFDSLYHVKRSLLEAGSDDSEDKQSPDISVKELFPLGTNARVVVLNACYNGAFQTKEGYIAGAHIFSNGKCVAAQGNTVNVLQDKFEDKLVGYLARGVRIGFWQKEIRFIESHLFGDPTFRFSSASRQDAGFAAALERDLVFSKDDAALWRKYMASDDPLARAAGVWHLADCSDASSAAVSAEILAFMERETSAVTKMHALDAIWKFADYNTSRAVREAVKEPFEPTVRLACRIAAASCDPSLAESMQYCLDHHPEMIRVCRTLAPQAIKILSAKEVVTYLNKGSVRSYRNNRYYLGIADLMEILKGKQRDFDLRLACAEALGWYNTALCRKTVARELQAYLDSGEADHGLRPEISKSIKRLGGAQ